MDNCKKTKKKLNKNPFEFNVEFDVEIVCLHGCGTLG